MITKYFRNFLSQQNKNLIKKITHCFSREVSPYSALNHTLMKNVYVFKQQDGYCGRSLIELNHRSFQKQYFYQIGYIIRDESSNQLLCVDPGKFDFAIEHVRLMESQTQSKLTHVLCTHHYHMTKDVNKFLTYNDEIKIVAGNQGENIAYHNQVAIDLRPFSVGELAICYFHTPGHSLDSYTIAITQVNESSTKMPIIFTGETLQISSIGEVKNNSYNQMLETIYKLKSFPNESLIFPSQDGQLENLLFAKSLDPSNPIINLKISLAKQAFLKKTHILPTSLFEEKSSNPFLRLQDNQILKHLNSQSPIDALKQLKKTQNIFYGIQSEN